MNFTNFIGIDISKKTLDICFLGDNVKQQFVIKNEAESINASFSRLFSEHQLLKENTLLCAEHTGHYGNILRGCMELEKYNFWLADPYTIKHSQGIQRGKNDVLDAERIATFAKRNQEDNVLIINDNSLYKRLSYLRSERDILVVDCAKYKAQLKDEAAFFNTEMYHNKKQRYEPLIEFLAENIKEIEAEIDALIKSDTKTKEQFDIIVSIDGIGPQTAIETLIVTEGFSKFSSARAFACHAGCAPFKYESGSSIRSKNRVSFRANKTLKSLFHMAALSCITMKKGEMRQYYDRKVAEGKNKMSVLNAIRSKLIHRIFSLIKNERKYEKIMPIPLQIS